MKWKVLVTLKIVAFIFLLALIGIGLYLASIGIMQSWMDPIIAKMFTSVNVEYPVTNILPVSITFIVISAIVLGLFVTTGVSEIRKPNPNAPTSQTPTNYI